MDSFAPVAFTHTLDRIPSRLLLCSGTLLSTLNNSSFILLQKIWVSCPRTQANTPGLQEGMQYQLHRSWLWTAHVLFDPSYISSLTSFIDHMLPAQHCGSTLADGVLKMTFRGRQHWLITAQRSKWQSQDIWIISSTVCCMSYACACAHTRKHPWKSHRWKDEPWGCLLLLHTAPCSFLLTREASILTVPEKLTCQHRKVEKSLFPGLLKDAPLGGTKQPARKETEAA